MFSNVLNKTSFKKIKITVIRVLHLTFISPSESIHLVKISYGAI